MRELKPCQFCGGEASKVWMPYIGGGGYGSVVECDTCFADEVTHRNCKYSVNRGWRERTCNMKLTTVGYSCSVCHSVDWTEKNKPKPKYCPNCGAKVVEQ